MVCLLKRASVWVPRNIHCSHFHGAFTVLTFGLLLLRWRANIFTFLPHFKGSHFSLRVNLETYSPLSSDRFGTIAVESISVVCIRAPGGNSRWLMSACFFFKVRGQSIWICVYDGGRVEVWHHPCYYFDEWNWRYWSLFQLKWLHVFILNKDLSTWLKVLSLLVLKKSFYKFKPLSKELMTVFFLFWCRFNS